MGGMGDPPGPVVAFLAVDGRADRLAAEHADDGTGHCCTCPAGPQAGRTTWPCTLANYAAAAREFAAGHPATSAGPLTLATRRGLDHVTGTNSLTPSAVAALSLS